jgi:hypothetical protein
VWDVGPWNTHDDYWNVRREQWLDLPPGLPEAQAAYQAGYHGRTDQFGRTVLNPAGIDLADGTIWDGLGIAGGSAWVQVSFLWTGSGTQGRVNAGGGTLNVRAAPSTRAASVGLAGPYARLPIECQTVGEFVAGYYGVTNVWDRVGRNNYVSHAFVTLDSGMRLPRC